MKFLHTCGIIIVYLATHDIMSKRIMKILGIHKHWPTEIKMIPQFMDWLFDTYEAKLPSLEFCQTSPPSEQKSHVRCVLRSIAKWKCYDNLDTKIRNSTVIDIQAFDKSVCCIRKCALTMGSEETILAIICELNASFS